MIEAVWLTARDDGWGDVEEKLFYDKADALNQLKAWIGQDILDIVTDYNKMVDTDEEEANGLIQWLTDDIKSMDIFTDDNDDIEAIIYGDCVLRIKELEIN